MSLFLVIVIVLVVVLAALAARLGLVVGWLFRRRCLSVSLKWFISIQDRWSLSGRVLGFRN